MLGHMLGYILGLRIGKISCIALGLHSRDLRMNSQLEKCLTICLDMYLAMCLTIYSTTCSVVHLALEMVKFLGPVSHSHDFGMNSHSFILV